jgi:hypothetical protein
VSNYFEFETDLLKHYVRTHGWLPSCRRRLRAIRAQNPKGKQRRLRYFTFCAAGAVDVLMLDVARIIRRSSSDKFDSVVFFDRTSEAVSETQKNIPGAIGFPGDFTTIVLLNDAADDDVVDDPLRSALPEPDTEATRRQQVILAQRRSLIRQFPFDVLNLDLEEFLLKPNDPLPGRVVNSLRRILGWQRTSLPAPHGRLDGFTLMFTTQIGPPNLSHEYLEMLEGYIRRNLQDDPALIEVLQHRTGMDDARRLRAGDFGTFFRLAMPKVIARIAMEEDWFIDPVHGITMYEFERPSRSGPYKMLHLVMDVKRQVPPRENRAPGEQGAGIEASYRRVARGIFDREHISVSNATIDAESLQQDLDRIFARRRKYLREE